MHIHGGFFFGMIGLLLGVGPVASNMANASAADVTISINPAHQRPISRYIYGANFAGRSVYPAGVFTLDRAGGNRWTAYDWTSNASNAGKDYLYENDAYLSASHVPAAAVTDLIVADEKMQMASVITVQMQGLVAGDERGPVSVQSPPDKARFKHVVFQKRSVSSSPFDATPSGDGDPVFMDEMLWAIDHRLPGRGIFSPDPSGQPVFVQLDNEPELWNSTHLEVQGSAPIRVDAFIAKTIALAGAVKDVFPGLVVLGPGNYGFAGLYSWDSQITGVTADSNNWFVDAYLAALARASAAAGHRLVDVYDFHWYPEATDGAGNRVVTLTAPQLNEAQVQAIVQSPRSLWDPGYTEKSWVTRVLGQPIALLHRLQSRIDAHAPGMSLSITEYNNGGGQHIAGTLAQADNLGIFADAGLFAANLWLLSDREPYILAGFRAYRNFDGAHHDFGDVSLESTSTDPSKVVVHVATDSHRPGRVVMVAINRSANAQSVAIRGQQLSGKAHVFQMTAESARSQKLIEPSFVKEFPVSATEMTIALAPLSVTTIDVY